MMQFEVASDYILDFNRSLDNVKDVKIFFGEHDGIQRYDRYKYQISEKLIRAQQAATWFPREINFSRDRTGFYNALSEEFREIYKANLLFQTMADSLANRFLDNILSEYITSPEWEAVIKWQAHFELVHSEAYSWNIREVFKDPEQFFNDGFRNENIRKRLDIEIESYSNLKTKLSHGTDNEKKMAIVEVLARQYALENIRFFVSFLYTFKINEMNGQVLQGSVNNIKLILNDEIIHTVIFRNLINILREQKDEGFSHLFGEDFLYDTDSLFITCFSEVIESEMEWFKYLSDIQDIIGFNDDTVRGFLEYYTYAALKYIGVEHEIFSSEQNELVLFFESRKNLNNTKALAQETNLLTYNIGVLEDGGFLDDDLDFDLNNYIETEVFKEMTKGTSNG